MMNMAVAAICTIVLNMTVTPINIRRTLRIVHSDEWGADYRLCANPTASVYLGQGSRRRTGRIHRAVFIVAGAFSLPSLSGDTYSVGG